MANTVFRNLETNEITLVTTNNHLFDGIVNNRVKPIIGDHNLYIDNVKYKDVTNWKQYHIKLRDRLESDPGIQLLTESTFIKTKNKKKLNYENDRNL